jgi:hypothetical protein
MRELRHVTIPDTHDRIPLMGPEGIEQISQADTDKLKGVIRTLAKGITLSEQQWTVFYHVQDELMERGEWSDDLALVGRRGQ